LNDSNGRLPGRALAVVALVAVAAGAGYFIQHGRQASAPALTVAPAPAQPAVAEAPVAAAAPAEAKTLPDVLPQFELKDRTGKMRKLGDWRGQPLVVNYWATWCPPCVREIPLLSRLRRDYQSRAVEVIGIAVDFREDVLAFADKNKLDYPLLIGEEDGLAAVNAVGMEPTFPFTLFADSQQRIIALKVGELHEDEAKLILDRVALIDAGQLDVTTARHEISEGLKELATQRATAGAAAAAG
jgi:peroxiredoxin